MAMSEREDYLLPVQSTVVFLEDVFRSVGKDGQMPIDVFVQAFSSHLRCPEQQILSALEEVRAQGRFHTEDANVVTSEEAVEVGHLLVPGEAWPGRKSEEPMTAAQRRVTRVKSLSEIMGDAATENVPQKLKARFLEARNWLLRRLGSSNSTTTEEVYSSKMRPTTRLLLAVLVMSMVMSLAVAGTAIGLSWTAQTNHVKDQLQREVHMVMHAVESFTFTQARQQALSNQYSTALMLADIVEEVGYNVNLQTTKTRQLTAVRTAAKFADTIFTSISEERVLTRATIMRDTLIELCTMNLAYSYIDFVDRYNVKRLTDAQEIILFKQETNGSIAWLSAPKNKARCPNNGACVLSPDINVAINRVLQGQKGSMRGKDYTSTDVFLAYTPVDCLGIGLVYTITFSSMQTNFVKQTILSADACNNDDVATPKTAELLIVQNGQSSLYGAKILTTKLNASLCVGSCDYDSAALVAISGNGTAVGKNYRNEDVLAVSGEMPNLNVTAIFELGMSELKEDILVQLGVAGSVINKKLNGTLELLLGKKVTVNGTDTFSFLTAPKFRDQCAPNCGTAPGAAQPMINAAVKCINGADFLTDYRSQAVLAAYVCSPKLGAGLVYKIDNAEILSRSIQQASEYANDQNVDEKGSAEIIIGSKASAVGGSVRYLSNYKFRSGVNCWTTPCLDQGASAGPMLAAFNGDRGIMRSPDYRGTSVFAAYQFSALLQTGFVLKLDVNEIESPLIVHLGILLGTAIGITLIGIAILGYSARVMLHSIEHTWEQGRLAVQRQKEGFERLVSALYPKFASERLLAGEVQIVVDVPKATIFFSDICNFTALSNQLSPSELLEWIGYTFRVMDQCAEYFHVYKIKTIGDAYLAITGLPNSLDQIEESPDHAFSMLQFASSVVQLFSGRYDHPSAGDCLAAMSARSVLIRKDQVVEHRKSRASVPASGGVGGGAKGGETTDEDDPEDAGALARVKSWRSMKKKKSKASIGTAGETKSVGTAPIAATAGLEPKQKTVCQMRFGLALGPVVAGVLHGACPQFDIWGKTVNLASRMEHSGRPGNVQCSEAVYQAVASDPRCLVQWEKPHTVFAKGFGMVQAYFMAKTDLHPPKELLLSLSIEPRTETFAFEGATAVGVAVRAPAAVASHSTLSLESA